MKLLNTKLGMICKTLVGRKIKKGQRKHTKKKTINILQSGYVF